MSRLLTPVIRNEVVRNEPVTNFRLRGLITIATDMSQTAAVVAFLTLTTILCHVASVTADATYDISCEVSLFWAIVFAMADLTTILTGLVLVITESAIECGKFT